jgi:hypothetical protein
LTSQAPNAVGAPASRDSREAGAPDAETEITPEMIRAGGECLNEYVRAGEGLENSSDFVAERVYRAMEMRRRRTSAFR